jgi:uroporphyrinogen-III synthase
MGAELSQQLAQLELFSIDAPVIINQEIAADSQHLPRQLDDPTCYWIFISKPSVQFFHQYLQRAGVQQFTPRGKVFAVGNSTASALQQHSKGLPVIVPQVANSEALLALAPLASARQVVLVKGQGGRGLIQQELEAKNISVVELDLYHREPKIYTAEQKKVWLACDLVLATSVDIAKALLANIDLLEPNTEKQTFLQNSRWLVLSERIKAFLIQRGLGAEQIHVCTASDNPSIIKLIKNLAK